LFQSLTPTVQSANTYYYLSPSNSKKKYKAEISLNKSIAIYKELNINSQDDLINLQKGIIYKANGNYNSASYCFNGDI
jgi:hypothetical protein